VDDLVLRMTTAYAMGQTTEYPEPHCRVIRMWTDYDEEIAEMYAEGFVEGFGHHDEDEGGGLPFMGCSSVGDEPAPALNIQVSSDPPVTILPPWERGFDWDADHGGWTRQTEQSGEIEFLPNTLALQEAFNKWQDQQDREGTNTR
jgi:hypothetical protein